MGIVDDLGEDVSNVKIGQKVAQITVIGSYSEYICLDAKNLVIVPDSINDEQAISLVLTYTTTYQLLHRIAKIQLGQTILIHGVTGAVGKALTQLGFLKNLKIYGTTSKHLPINDSYHSVYPIDYKTEDFETILKLKEPRGIDAVFDPIGGEQLHKSLNILKKTGTLIDFGFHGLSQGKRGNVYLDFIKVLVWNFLPWLPNALFYDITTFNKKHPLFFNKDLQVLFQLLKENKIKPEIASIIGFEDIQEAHKLVEQGQTIGKIILKP